MPPAPLVLCAGQYGSASTWIYNAVHALMAEVPGAMAVQRQYADSPDDIALPPRRDVALLLKTHMPSAGLRWLALRGGGRVVLSVREPRDAAASLIQRFGFGYPLVASRIERSGAALPPVLADLPCLVLRYEDGFSRSPRSLMRLARFLGLRPSAAVVEEVFARLTPAAVQGEIARLAAAGVFGATPTAHSHDPESHWHPGHVGDGEPGKFAQVLTEGQAGDILRRTRAYQAAFDYPAPPPPQLEPGRDLALQGWGPGLAYLGQGFAAPTEDGAWTEGPEAALHLPRPPGAWRLRLALALPRAAPRRNRPDVVNPMRWSLQDADTQEPLAGPYAAADTPEQHAITIDLPEGLATLLLCCEGLVPARDAGSDRSDRLLGLRLTGFALLPP
jgi:hypothetical protein